MGCSKDQLFVKMETVVFEMHLHFVCCRNVPRYHNHIIRWRAFDNGELMKWKKTLTPVTHTHTSLGAWISMNSWKILLALDTSLVELLIFLYSSQAIQNSIFSSLNSVLRNDRKAARPSVKDKNKTTKKKKIRMLREDVKTIRHFTNMMDTAAFAPISV